MIDRFTTDGFITGVGEEARHVIDNALLSLALLRVLLMHLYHMYMHIHIHTHTHTHIHMYIDMYTLMYLGQEHRVMPLNPLDFERVRLRRALLRAS